ncbi:hypothetical protein H112_06315 [Trichophyton rubrum D6]|uniref:Uncharacterized protein n=3 Tax=Trichophyton TaxID=5550 RepID=F2SHF5_TRIRC|nr:uncharacterized protein TERG_01686 [Trichophyton rubrum CBS 118892]EZF13166.1 hypothetical protein H100_06329 [Trichophyton rubrum MR850]EZF39696.1 hypothetical protein H102_06296 [Trichophyton rubrum CBS 100081]EZF50220.1 hypothetical protein H103_06321 [Trichophyton rubrum CBS 288.86]EZF60852.1 hypothetical protein H104_06308 [Trichophyton rubrum CBS 289.86]EZF71370.1 hypothetical protein H105_06336 [Trichophyton soudanense CBS 452.61]EZF82179.1 hypothetical protein H110_06318 [Trichophy
MKVKDDEEMRGCKHSNLHQLQLDSLISNPFTHGTDLVPFDTSHKMTYICRRSYSSNSKPPSPHVMVYKNFGRPFIKLFIGSLVCYQAAYWAWNKLEREDIIHRSGSGNRKPAQPPNN